MRFPVFLASVPRHFLVPPSESVGANLEWTDDRVGPVELGMTLTEASSALPGLAVDPDLAPGPDCWHAVITGDPHSPIFVVRAAGREEPTIAAVVRFYQLKSVREWILASTDTTCS